MFERSDIELTVNMGLEFYYEGLSLTKWFALKGFKTLLMARLDLIKSDTMQYYFVVIIF